MLTNLHVLSQYLIICATLLKVCCTCTSHSSTSKDQTTLDATTFPGVIEITSEVKSTLRKFKLLHGYARFMKMDLVSASNFVCDKP